jgi:hypothetical protein
MPANLIPFPPSVIRDLPAWARNIADMLERRELGEITTAVCVLRGKGRIEVLSAGDRSEREATVCVLDEAKASLHLVDLD